MNDTFDTREPAAKIKVIGVGGGGEPPPAVGAARAPGAERREAERRQLLSGAPGRQAPRGHAGLRGHPHQAGGQEQEGAAAVLRQHPSGEEQDQDLEDVHDSAAAGAGAFFFPRMRARITPIS